MKHRLKKMLRRAVALVFHHLGLRGAFRRARGGIPVVMFHNVGYSEETAYLPGHMKVGEARLKRLLKLLKRAGYRTLTVGQMLESLRRGEVPHDAVVLTFDDGYRDNLTVLLPLLQEHDATATIFVQTGPMKGKLNWLHHYFWVLHRRGPHRLGAMLAEHVSRQHTRADLLNLPPGDVPGEYELKRLLKYDVLPDERDEILRRIFEEAGGDERKLADEVYLSPDDCRALDAAGIELGAHTVNHLVLSSLEPNQQRREIEGSLRDLQSWLGHEVPTFAYPYGRLWDFDEHTLEILRDLGFAGAITAMPGVNDGSTPPYELRRFAMNDDSHIGEVMCDIDGVYTWFERRGLRLTV